MSSHGGKFLGGYRQFVRRFIHGYLLLCCAALLALLIIDVLFPATRVYERLAGVLRAAFPPSAGPAP
jgi:hypothetical protein